MFAVDSIESPPAERRYAGLSPQQYKAMWNITNDTARFDAAELRGTLELTHPQAGITDVDWQGAPLAGALLSLAWSADEASLSQAGSAPGDVYVRDDDLVVTYPQTAQRPYRTVVYWRVEPVGNDGSAGTAISLTISSNTDLLDSRPALGVVTRLPAEQLLDVSGDAVDRFQAIDVERDTEIVVKERSEREIHCPLYRLAGGATSYAEMVESVDFERLMLRFQTDGEAQTSWRLFGQFLEKGVIRRTRMQAVFLPRDDDLGRLAASYAAWQAREVSLTT